MSGKIIIFTWKLTAAVKDVWKNLGGNIFYENFQNVITAVGNMATNTPPLMFSEWADREKSVIDVMKESFMEFFTATSFFVVQLTDAILMLARPQ
jgi:hypothetical protein